MLSIVSTIFLSIQTGLTPLLISSTSSACIKFGISPVFKRLLRFSIKLSEIIYVSVITKDIPVPVIPDYFINPFMNSKKFYNL